MIVSVFFSIWKRKWTKNTPVPVLVIFSDFFDKKVCSWFDVFLTRILQEIFFCQVLARFVFFCQDLARIVFIFNQRSEDKVEVFCKVRFALVQILE